MADDLSGLMEAMGVSNPLTSVYARAIPGSTSANAAPETAAASPQTNAKGDIINAPRTAQPQPQGQVRSGVWDGYMGTNWQQKSATDPGGQNQMLAQLKMLWDNGETPPAGFEVPQAWKDERNQKQAALAAAQKQTPQQMQAAQQQNTMRGLYDSLLQRAMMSQSNDGSNPTGTGFIDSLTSAMRQPGGSAAWMQEQKQSAIPAMQQMPEWSQWGMDKYNWTPGDNFGMKLPAQPAAPASTTPAPPPVPTSQNSPMLQQPQAFRTPQALKRATIGKRRSGGI